MECVSLCGAVSEYALSLPLQTCVIGIHRCDYMLDWNETDDNLALKQIEMNTISCSNMGLSSKLKSFYE